MSGGIMKYRYLLGLFLLGFQLCTLPQKGMATPSSNEIDLEVMEEVKQLFKSSRGLVSELDKKYKAEFTAIESAQRAQGRLLSDQAENQKKALNLLDTSLSTAVVELFTANAQIAIIPSIVKFADQLVLMTDFYRQQSGSPVGSETLSCGVSCEHFQKRRNALSGMIGFLRDDLVNLSGIVRKRREKVEQIAGELSTLRQNGSSSLARFGFDHFINLRVALLEGQSEIVEDIQRLGAQLNFAGQAELVPAPCAPGVYTFTSFSSDVQLLSALTAGWSASGDPLQQFNVNQWIQGTTQNPGPLKARRNQYLGYTDTDGIYRPGWLDNWGGCSQTKTNVLNDFRSKVEAEVRLGNMGAARKLDEETLTLQVEVDVLTAHRSRLEQFSTLLQKLGTIATSHAAVPKANEAWSDMWKSSVISQIKNIERVLLAQREALFASQILLRLAEEQLLPLALISDADERSAKLLSVQRRLEAISKQGLERIELELTLAAGSLDTMSANILSSEGIAGEGGLGEAILAYDTITKVRSSQMKTERDVELPVRRQKAEALVAELEQSRAIAIATLLDIEKRQAELRVLGDELKGLKTRVEGFFGVKVSHPFYSDLARRFLVDLKVSTAVRNRIIKKGVRSVLKSFSTVGTGGSAYKGPPFTKLGLMARSLRTKYGRRIRQLADEISSPQLGGVSFSSIAKYLKEIKAKGASL